MSDRSQATDDLRCIEFVALASRYLDGEVSNDQRIHIERHLEGCKGCRDALKQMRSVIRLTGRLTVADVADIDPLIRDRLRAVLRLPRRR